MSVLTVESVIWLWKTGDERDIKRVILATISGIEPSIRWLCPKVQHLKLWTSRKLWEQGDSPVIFFGGALFSEPKNIKKHVGMIPRLANSLSRHLRPVQACGSFAVTRRGVFSRKNSAAWTKISKRTWDIGWGWRCLSESRILHEKTRCSTRTRMLTHMLMVQMSKHMAMQSRRTHLCNSLFEQSCTSFPCYQSAVWSGNCRVWSKECTV